MGKGSKGSSIGDPKPDPELAKRIDALQTQLDTQRSTAAAQDADWRARESQWLQTQSQLISDRARSDELTKSLTETNQKLLDAQATAAAMQIPTQSPDAPVTDIGDDAATIAETVRRRTEAAKARRGRSSLLIPTVGTGSSGTGLVIPG